MDDELNILHLRLAIVGGIVIVAFGLISLLGYHNMPVLSFVVGPLISISSWRALKGIEHRKGFVEIRLRNRRRR
jgi:hypothetical protein